MLTFTMHFMKARGHSMKSLIFPLVALATSNQASGFSTLKATDIEVHNRQRKLFEISELIVTPDSRLTIVGDNGAGKSTFAKILAGQQAATYGEVSSSDDLTVGYLPQEPLIESFIDPSQAIFSYMAKHDSTLSEVAIQMALSLSDTILHERTWSKESYRDLEQTFNRAGGYELRKIMSGMRVDHLPLYRSLDSISPGELTRVMLTQLLFQNPDIIILDEPTNHLDHKTLNWLENFLRQYSGGIVLITHDRHLLSSITREIIEFNSLTGEVCSFRGTYQDYLNRKHQQQERDLQQYHEKKKKISTLKNSVSDTRQEMNRSRKKKDNDKIAFKGKGERSQGKTSRLEKKLRQQISELEDDTTHQPLLSHKNTWLFDTTKKVSTTISLNDITMSFGNQCVLDQCSAIITPGEKIIITGDNGAGKSTLMKIIAGELPPSSGSISFSSQPKVGYLAQTQDALNTEMTAVDFLCETMGYHQQQAIAALLELDLLPKSSCFIPISQLSIGQQRRLLLAQLILLEPDVLLLDEPTNHLDCMNAEYLENQLEAFQGTIIAISHDRYFIEKFNQQLWKIENSKLLIEERKPRQCPRS